MADEPNTTKNETEYMSYRVIYHPERIGEAVLVNRGIRGTLEPSWRHDSYCITVVGEAWVSPRPNDVAIHVANGIEIPVAEIEHDRANAVDLARRLKEVMVYQLGRFLVHGESLPQGGAHVPIRRKHQTGDNEQGAV